jgi:hypothetical protein
VEHRLVGVTEIAEMLNLSRQRADQITRTYADFPEPGGTLIPVADPACERGAS